jgi:hypothetical protein
MIVDHDRVVDVSTERRDDVETERVPATGSPLGDSRTTSRPGPIRGLASRRRAGRAAKP